MTQRRTPFGARARYWFDSTLARGTSALFGWMVLLCLGVVVPASAVLVWTDPAAPASLTGRLALVWHLTGETLRLGGTTGTPLRMLMSVLLALIALLYVSTLVGLITTALTERLTALRRGRSTVLEQGHAVILGWSEQVFTVVGELVAANANQRRAAVAVLADRDKTAMEEALATKVGPLGRTRLICRSGPTTDPAVLALASPATAGVVLVLPHDEPDADAEVVKTLLALRAALAGQGNQPLVVAAVRDDRYRLAAALAAGPGGVVLESDTVTARMIVQAARRSGLSLVHQELLDFAGDEFYLVAEPSLTGRQFGDALLSYATSSVVGVMRGDTPLLSPPPHTLLLPDDLLIVLTRDDDTARPEDCAEPAEEAAMTSGPPTPARPERVLLLGWNRRAPLIVEQLRRRTRPGSVVDVVADSGGATARQIDEAAGTTKTTGTDKTIETAVNETHEPTEPTEPTETTETEEADEAVQSAETDTRGDTAPTPTPAPTPPLDPAPAPAPAPPLTLTLHRGDITRPDTLHRLDVHSYDSVIVLGQDSAPGQPPEDPDNRTLITLLLLRRLEEATGRPLPVVTELIDDRNRALAPISPGADVIISGKLIGLLMAQISQNRHLAAVFEELFSADGAGVRLRPAGDYVLPGCETSFATVVAAARRRGECAIGYRSQDGSSTGPGYGLRINPHKAERRRWTAEDEVVVVGQD
ncbi:Trk K+ transport system NAD-binding subunit [Streptomyces sp. B3I7]|uniref:CASTOR/POLLUX-related putative ion channel n=1 Tax=Streptomyces sp. B3I7 TaxID=3042269 RepID=UPI00278AD5F3|nr:NAD-binding lipoprotein [Streptomyces sp. B3I7]MDQ0810023.1 Trk K+ transport system NAD-binding subunit [Streptomyces sp. B3I7]